MSDFPASPPAIVRQISGVSSYIQAKTGSAEKAKYYAPLITRRARQHRIPPLLLASLVYHESEFNPREISTAGALGLGQIMPFWFRHHQTPLHLWRDPGTNLTLTCKILTYYHNQASRKYPGLPSNQVWHRTLVAYNMGFSRVTRGTFRSRYSTRVLGDTQQ